MENEPTGLQPNAVLNMRNFSKVAAVRTSRCRQAQTGTGGAVALSDIEISIRHLSKKLLPLILLLALYLVPVQVGFAHEGENEAFSTGNTPQEIKVDDQSIRALRITTAKVTKSVVNELLRTTGNVQSAETRTFDVTPSVSGMVQNVFVKQGDTLTQGQVMGEIYSIEVAKELTDLLSERTKTNSEISRIETQYKSDIVLQKNELQLAKFTLDREEQMLGEGITARKSYQEAKNDYEQAKIKLQTLELRMQQERALLEKQLAVTIETSKGQLRIMGLAPKKVDEALKTGQVIATIPIVAPVSGIITQRDITLGERVEPGKRVFSIVDLSPIWVMIDIYQEQIQKVHIGQQVTIATPTKQILTGKITTIGPTVDEENKTMHVRIISENKNGILRPGMFVTAEIVLGHSSETRISVPSAAVIDDRGRHLVYLKKHDAFVPTFIETGLQTADGVEVLSGLPEHSEIVVSGARQLLAASLIRPKEETHQGENHAEHEHGPSSPRVNENAHTLVIFAAGVVSVLLLIALGMALSRLFSRKKVP